MSTKTRLFHFVARASMRLAAFSGPRSLLLVMFLALMNPMAANADEIARGDRLRLTVFETFERRALAGRIETDLRDLVERPDIGGEFVVSLSGSIFLPVLGSIEIAGLNLEEAAARVEELLQGMITADPRVGISVIAREPVYLTGEIQRPGMVDHVPGMTVLHALTIAGGQREMDTQTWQRLDLSRERERLARAQMRLVTLVATGDVLEAVQHDRRVEPSPRLVSLTSSGQAGRLISEIEETERLTLARRVNDEASYDRAVAAAEVEIATLQRSLGEIERSLGARRQRVSTLEDALSRRRTTLQVVTAAQSELAEALGRRSALFASLSRIEREVEQLRREQTRAEFDARIDAGERLARIRSEIAQEEITVEFLSANLRTLPPLSVERADAGGRMIEIIRRTSSGVERIPADELTEVKPGDMINFVPVRDSRRASR